MGDRSRNASGRNTRVMDRDLRAGNWLIGHRARILAAIALAAIAVGGGFHLAGNGSRRRRDLAYGPRPARGELAIEVGRTVVVERQMGVDTIALVAMVGALALGELLAGVVIGLMFSGGLALGGTRLGAGPPRADRAGRTGTEAGAGPTWTGRSATSRSSAVKVGDVAVVRTGEVIPVDGTLVSGQAVIDTSTLTGEPLPVNLSRGMSVLSGTANAGAPFEVRAGRPAAESAYSALVRLVSQAETERAPLVRIADRYAGFFLPATHADRRPRLGA